MHHLLGGVQRRLATAFGGLSQLLWPFLMRVTRLTGAAGRGARGCSGWGPDRAAPPPAERPRRAPLAEAPATELLLVYLDLDLIDFL